MDTVSVVERGRAVMRAEASSILSLAERLDTTFALAVQALLECEGRVITTGIGKAGAIARKVAATLASTGSPALFVHPADGVHGDLGAVTDRDVVLAFSFSGESDEVSRTLPTIRRIGSRLVAVTGCPQSTLAKAADLILDIGAANEACPLGLAPTTSTTTMLALGDALAMATMEARGFTRDDFALYHPAGALGRRLTLRVSDVMRTGEAVAVVRRAALLRDALFAITKAGAGAAFVTDDTGRLAGILTDGDARRALLGNSNALEAPVESFMNTDPIVIVGNPLATEALTILQESARRPGEAPVVTPEGVPIGCIMLKDLLRSGVV